MRIDYDMKIPKASPEKTGKKIRELRQARNISVDDISFMLDISSNHTVYSWEKGINYPNMDHLVGLAAILNVKLDDIIQIEESED